MPLANSIGCGKYDDKLGHWVNIYGPLMKYFHPFCWTKLWFSIKDKMGPAPVCWGCLTHNGHNWLLRANKMLRDSKDTINSHPTAADSWFTLKIKIYVIWILVNTTHLSTELFHWTFSTSCLLSVEKTLAAYDIFLELNSCKRVNEKIPEKTKTEKVYLSENTLRLSQPAAAWQPSCE